MNDLLALLSENARLTTAQLAVMLQNRGGSGRPDQRRLKKAASSRGYNALIDWDKAPVKSASAIIELKVTRKGKPALTKSPAR